MVKFKKILGIILLILIFPLLGILASVINNDPILTGILAGTGALGVLIIIILLTILILWLLDI